MTSMRLDVQRKLTGWSPHLSVDAPIPEDEDPIEEPIDEEPEVVIEYNTMDIDFDELIASEDDSGIIDMHNYFKMSLPAKNEYTGIYEGYNLIFITAEDSPLCNT